jgi:CBS domain-containing protein
MEIQSIMTRRVAAVAPGERLAKAARLMREEDVGCVLVLNDDRQAVGIVTDRDIVLRTLARGRDPAQVRVEEIMSRDPVTARTHEPVLITARRMAQEAVRRLPVVDEAGHVVGLISVDDLLTVFITELSNVAAAIAGSSRLLK